VARQDRGCPSSTGWLLTLPHLIELPNPSNVTETSGRKGKKKQRKTEKNQKNLSWIRLEFNQRGKETRIAQDSTRKDKNNTKNKIKDETSKAAACETFPHLILAEAAPLTFLLEEPLNSSQKRNEHVKKGRSVQWSLKLK
jgi:hypothetical protein